MSNTKQALIEVVKQQFEVDLTEQHITDGTAF